MVNLTFIPLDEARLKQAPRLRELKHHHILPLLTLEIYEDSLCVVELPVEGVTMQQRLEAGELLSISEIMELGLALARALEYAHSRDIVHGALHPRQILFTSAGIKVRGFGGQPEEQALMLEIFSALVPLEVFLVAIKYYLE